MMFSSKKPGSIAIIIACLILVGLAIFSIVCGAATVSDRTGVQKKDNAALSGSETCGNVPEPYKTIFDKASSARGAPSALIAAIFSCGEHGGGWPSSNGPWASSSAGAKGPFQFTDATWTQYGVDGDGDGKKDVQNLTDAAFSSSNMLSANIKSNSGTQEEKIKKAIFRYNHADWYVDQVYKCYQKFSCETSGGGCDNPTNLKKIYGSTSSEVKAQLVSVNFMGHKVLFHKLAAPYLEAVASDIKKSGTTYKFRRIGTFSWRANVNDPSQMSLHSFGIAIDINDDVNCNGCTRSDFPPEVINAFKSHGFRWGGDYHGKKDPMHFEWLGYGCDGTKTVN